MLAVTRPEKRLGICRNHVDSVGTVLNLASTFLFRKIAFCSPWENNAAAEYGAGIRTHLPLMLFSLRFGLVPRIPMFGRKPKPSSS
jgi:hypothetical protein